LSRDEAEGSSQPIVDAAVHRAIQRHAPVVPPQALENIGGRCFSGHATHGSAAELRAIEISTLMVNLGRRCNQACRHCHVDAGPNRTEEMDRETVDDVLAALTRFGIATLDITGGAPELNPHFRYLASEAARRGVRVVDRCNLTILFEPGQEDLPEFLAKHGIHVTASLPSDEETVADQQRGAGTFAKSVAALHKLNALGYGRAGSGLMLNLVFNPSGTELHPPQSELERRYKHELLRRYGIEFNHLLAMNNMPINRFESYLKREGRAADYIDGLAASFNRDAVGGLMCRHSMSVGWDGRLYDCDFNQVLDIPLDRGMPVHIREFNADMLRHRVIRAAKHCFGCTAGTGSSCNGALVGETIQLNVESRRNGRVPAVGEAHA
jgi:radical SAM/Cys-rich protein